MASAAVAGQRAFGIDRGLPFPISDIPGAEVVLMFGGNPAETMPPNINIAAVGITILVRLAVGPLADKYGPRRTYAAMLVLGAVPVLGIAFAQSYAVFLLFRLLIGAVGASFVITQYHTSVMFAPNVVGTANAASAGWGNSGGGVTQSVMPWVLAALLSLRVTQHMSWGLAMILPAALMVIVGVLYWKLTRALGRICLRPASKILEVSE
jgi:MFS transporter, NNP family, nitrate/nitrite transporter